MNERTEFEPRMYPQGYGISDGRSVHRARSEFSYTRLTPYAGTASVCGQYVILREVHEPGSTPARDCRNCARILRARQ